MPQRIDWQTVKQAASDVREFAYAPYSNFRVGAAVVTATGQVFSGCNVENASYGLTICAERAALVKAVSAGEKRILGIAICASPLAAPCGACRQFLIEFGEKIKVISFDPDRPKAEKRWTSGKLLPEHFKLQ